MLFQIHEVTVPLSPELTSIRESFIFVMKSVVDRLVNMKVIPPRDPDKLPQVLLLQWKDELMRYAVEVSPALLALLA